MASGFGEFQITEGLSYLHLLLLVAVRKPVTVCLCVYVCICFLTQEITQYDAPEPDIMLNSLVTHIHIARLSKSAANWNEEDWKEKLLNQWEAIPVNIGQVCIWLGTDLMRLKYSESFFVQAPPSF